MEIEEECVRFVIRKLEVVINHRNPINPFRAGFFFFFERKKLFAWKLKKIVYLENVFVREMSEYIQSQPRLRRRKKFKSIRKSKPGRRKFLRRLNFREDWVLWRTFSIRK